MAKIPPALTSGLQQHRSGDLSGAEQAYRLVLRDDPDHADALCLLGAVCLALGRFDEAVAHLRRALQVRPDYPEAHNNLGIGLGETGRLGEAEVSFRAALRLRPGYAEAHNNLGTVLRDAGRLDEAEASFRDAIRLKPDYAEAHMNLGVALSDRGAFEEAIPSLEWSLRIHPGSSVARANLANALRDKGELDRAEEVYLEALRSDPDNAEAHYNRALGQLLRGNFEEGWRGYEWRWRCRSFPKRSFDRPAWDGSPLAGRTILLHAEQGLGDVLQFIRFARPVKERGGTVVVECPGALCRLLERTPGVDRCVARGEALPAFDVQVPLMSLPRILGTTVETIPAEVPYIVPDPGRAEHWRRELGGFDGIKVGVCWQGNPNYSGDRRRSFPLDRLAPLARVPGVRLFSLQKGHGAEQVEALAGRFAVTDLGPRLDESAGAFTDTAAAMTALDLVVAPNTAVAHLAGALGVPAWVALPASLEWRWMTGREDSPWYPSMRLFRRTATGDWAEVFERMAAALRARVAPPGRAIVVEISPGELIDRITILEIKSERIADPAKLANIRRQLGALQALRDREIGDPEGLAPLSGELRAINESIWESEEGLRACERSEDFGAWFVELARTVYRQNDRRAAVKRAIDERLGSTLFEEKSYQG